MLLFCFLIFSVQTIVAQLDIREIHNPNEVLIVFRITGYTNTNRSLPDGNTCESPTFIDSLTRMPSKCRIQFELRTSIDRYNAVHGKTGFSYLNETGQLPDNTKNSWGSDIVMRLSSVPFDIKVVTQHEGGVFNKSNGQRVIQNGLKELTLLDEFYIYLLHFHAPKIDNNVIILNEQYQGEILGNSLFASLSITCLGSPPIDGSFCDFTCERSKIDRNVTRCVSLESPGTYICEYVNDMKVDRCEKCRWGVRNGTYCDEWTWRKSLPRFDFVRDLKCGEIVINIIFLLICAMVIVMAIVYRKASKEQFYAKVFPA